MDLPGPLAWLVDEAGFPPPGPTGSWPSSAAGCLADGLPLTGGALTLACRIRSSPAALVVAGGDRVDDRGAWALRRSAQPSRRERLAELDRPADMIAGAGRPVLAWAGTRPFGLAEVTGCVGSRASSRRPWRP